MPVQLKKKLNSISETIAILDSQVYTEVDVIVPDIKPDIAKILQIDVRPVITEKNVTSDKINIDGRVDINIIYISDNQHIKNVVTSSKFNHRVDNKSITQDMDVVLECETENIDYYLLNSRKVNIQSRIGICARVSKTNNIELTVGLEDENFEVCTKDTDIYSIKHRSCYPITVKSNIELASNKPNIDEILKIDVRALSQEIQTSINQIGLLGNLEINVIYLSDIGTNNIQTIDNIIEFSENIEIPDIDNDDIQCDVDYVVKDIIYNVKENDDGENKIILIQVMIEANLKVGCQNKIPLLSDTYCIKDEVILDTDVLNTEKIIAERKVQNSFKEILSINEGAAKIRRICYVDHSIEITETNLDDNELIVGGVVKFNTLYLCDDLSIVMSYCKNEIPFSHKLPIEIYEKQTSELMFDIKSNINKFSSSTMSDTQFEVKFVIDLNIKVMETEKITHVKEVNINENCPPLETNNCCMRVYFVKDGDTLWDIAKKYRVKIDSLKEFNEIYEDVVVPGMKILLT